MNRATILCLLLSLVVSPQKTQERPRFDVPALAKFAQVRVGFDTIETMEKLYGPGKECLGGHSNGGRVWRLRGSDLRLYADGFDHWDGNYRRGRVLDQVKVGFEGETAENVPFATAKERRQPIPWAKLTPNSIKLFGVFSVGMSRRQAEKLAVQELSPTSVSKTEMVWKAKGYVKVKSDIINTNWSARLGFGEDEVVAITVQVD